jgi:hypothetical protein
MNKILLLVTKGCAACTIMNRLIKEALNNTERPITYEVQDVRNANKVFLIENDISDFPTTCFIKDDILKYKHIGTAPAIVINRFIDIHLK